MPSYGRLPLVLILIAGALALAACGGDDGGSDEGGGAPAPAEATADPKEAIVTAVTDYYTARRTGDAETACNVSSEAFLEQQYDNGLDECLADPNKSSTNAVIEKNVKVEVARVGPDSADVRAFALSPDTALDVTLVLVDGKWLIESGA